MDGGGRRGDLGAVEVALAGLVLVLLALTVVVLTGQWVPAVVNDRLDMAILTAATLVAGAVAALDWARARVTRDPAAYLRSSAFAVLWILNGVTLIAGVTGTDAVLGASLEQPSQLPIVAGVVSRAVAAVILVLAGWVAVSRWVPTFRPSVVLLAPGSAVLVVLILAAMAGDAIPALVPPYVVDRLGSEPTAPLGLSAAPALLITQTLIGAAFVAASVLAYQSFRRSRRLGDALLAGGLLIAAVSQLHSAIHPGSYSSLVTTADLLRLAFYGLLLVGVVTESRQDLADLRAATVEVRRLAAAQFAAAGLEERARLAREIHDGLAQDLWYAKLKQSRLAQLAGFEGETQRLSDEVEGAIDSALAEARHAIAAMRQGADSGPLVDMLARQVDDFSDRFALRAELTAEGQVAELGPRAQAEVLRIVQEAMTNARRHADATVVQVRVTAADEGVRIVVSDNGAGFTPDTVKGGFGLDSMRQRAAVIGGSLMISSQPQNGTRVELTVPAR